jgi:hypothetical protein
MNLKFFVFFTVLGVAVYFFPSLTLAAIPETWVCEYEARGNIQLNKSEKLKFDFGKHKDKKKEIFLNVGSKEVMLKNSPIGGKLKLLNLWEAGNKIDPKRLTWYYIEDGGLNYRLWSFHPESMRVIEQISFLVPDHSVNSHTFWLKCK